MKIAVVLMALALVALVAFNSAAIISLINSGTSMLDGIDAPSLKGKALVPFALPHSHYKASFPGAPHVPPVSQQLFVSGIQSGECRVMADKEQVYYLSEYNLPSMSLGGAGLINGGTAFGAPVDFSNPALGARGVAESGNNSLVNSANSNSEPLKIQEALDKFARSWIDEHHARLEGNLPTALRGGLYSGKEITGVLNDGKKRFRLRFYCNYPAKTIVVIGAVGEPGRVDSADTGRFIDSLDMWP